MQKKYFLSIILFASIFFLGIFLLVLFLSAPTVLSQAKSAKPLLFIDNLSPTRPKVGQEVMLSIRIRMDTKDGCGWTYISAPAPPDNTMLVEFGDGNFSTLDCIASRTSIGSSIYGCSTNFYHSYKSPGTYLIKMRARYAPRECPEWAEISISITVGDPPPPPSVLCGNNVIDGGEDCDGLELGGKDCRDFRDSSGKKYAEGVLGCYPSHHARQCKFDFSGCIPFSPPPPPLPSTKYDNPLIWDSITNPILYFTGLIFNICMGFSVLMILIGAFLLVVGAGNPLKREKAKKIIIWALIGFSITMMSQGIFQLFRLIFGVRDF